MIKLRLIMGTAGATIIGGVAQFALTMIAARSLTPDENGHYAQFILIFNLTYIFLNFGINTATTYLIASNPSMLPSLLRIGKNYLLTLGGLLIIIAFASTATNASNVTDALKIPQHIFWLGVAGGYFYIIFVQHTSVLMGQQRFQPYNILNIARNAIPLTTILLTIAVIEPTSVAFSTAHAVALLLSALLAYRSIGSTYKNDITSKTRDSLILKRALKYGATTFSSNLFHYSAMRGLLIILSAHTESKVVGFINIALLLLEITLLLPTAIGQLMFPQASDPKLDTNSINQLIRYNIYIGIIIASTCLLASHFVIEFVYGHAYLEVADLLNTLTPSMIFLAIPRILSQILSGRGKPHIPLIAAAISFTMGISSAVIFTQEYGANAICWIINGTSLITATITMIGYSKACGHTISSIIKPSSKDWDRINPFK